MDYKLTPRETIVLQMLKEGSSVKEISKSGLVCACSQKGGYTNKPVGIAQIYNIKKRIRRKLEKYHNVNIDDLL